MSAMVCSSCGRMGMYWENLAGLSPWTYCPHCEGPRQPTPEEPEPEEEEQEDD